jgi:hypothetical protein
MPYLPQRRYIEQGISFTMDDFYYLFIYLLGLSM